MQRTRVKGHYARNGVHSAPLDTAELEAEVQLNLPEVSGQLRH